MSDALSIIMEHVARTMPDSISGRLTLLEAQRALLKPQHPAWKNICEQRHALKSAQRLQSELPLNFTKEAA